MKLSIKYMSIHIACDEDYRSSECFHKVQGGI